MSPTGSREEPGAVGSITHSPWPAAADPAPGHPLHDSVWGWLVGGLVGRRAALSSKSCGCRMYPDAAIGRACPVSGRGAQRLWVDSPWGALAPRLEQGWGERPGGSWEAGPTSFRLEDRCHQPRSVWNLRGPREPLLGGWPEGQHWGDVSPWVTVGAGGGTSSAEG